MMGSGEAGSEMSMAGVRPGGGNSFEPPNAELDGDREDDNAVPSTTTLSASCRAQEGSGGASPLILLLVLGIVIYHRRLKERSQSV